MSDDYRPGDCNVGRAERRKRLAVGVLGFVAALAVVGVVIVLSWPAMALLVTMLPLFVGFLGVAQYRRSFCVGFARMGVYDVSETGGNRRQVPDDQAHQDDVQTARRIYRDAALSAAAVGIGLSVVGGVVL